MGQMYDDFHEAMNDLIAEAEIDHADAEQYGGEVEKAMAWAERKCFNKALKIYEGLNVVALSESDRVISKEYIESLEAELKKARSMVKTAFNEGWQCCESDTNRRGTWRGFWNRSSARRNLGEPEPE